MSYRFRGQKYIRKPAGSEALEKVKKISQINTHSQNQETIHVDVEVRE